MYSSPIPPPQSASASAAAASVSPPPPSERSKEMVYRTKVIQFLGRKAPIILQNDNGPCPLLAICNVLSLKNILNLSPDFSEVSQEKLLSLVAERLIDSNTNINNKDTVYVENQQQNIADAIDLLPRLTTGIDVNIKFKRIDDFEFTPECAIFDLLDIPLYHGWIVDPQDLETADAIGFNSYNTLMGELVSLETKTMESDQKKNPEDDSVDFVAATTASLGVPSPSLSRSQSFQESPRATRKGDIEEEIELVKALSVSGTEKSSFTESVVNDVNVHDSAFDKKSEVVTDSEDVEKKDTVEPVICLIADDCSTLKDHDINLNSAAVVSQIIIGQGSRHTQTGCEDSREHGDIVVGSDVGIENEKLHHVSSGQNSPAFDNSQDESREHCDIVCEDSREHGDIVVGSDAGIENEKLHRVSSGQNPPAFDNSQDESRSDEYAPNESTTTSDKDEPINHQKACEQNDMFNLLKGDEHGSSDSDVTSGLMQHVHEQKSFSSSIDSTEPIYEGEERILDSGSVAYDNQEPVYEGEVVLAEQVERGSTDVGGLNSKEISVKQGEIIRNFMKNSASQITVYGLFCLQDKVKERELCVFFRNNHFNTMFKYEGELYILATDQGFINQPDLVWEKLNEVNGDTEYMTCNFKEFKMDDHSNSTWDEQNVMTSTADYLASIDNAEENSSFNSDLQLAIALQQQEFDQQQQQQQQPQQEQQPASSGNSRMVTGPQVPRGKDKYPSSSKQESKSKEKCIIM